MFFIDMEGLDEALLEMAYSGDKDDECFAKFKKAISSVPEQIIRYFVVVYLYFLATCTRLSLALNMFIRSYTSVAQ